MAISSSSSQYSAELHTIIYPNYEFVFANTIFDMFLNREHADLIFICKNGDKVYAHKCLVTSASKFLWQVINSSDEDVIYVSLPDVEQKQLENVLKLIYEGVLKVYLYDMICMKEIISFLDFHLNNSEVCPMMPENNIATEDNNETALECKNYAFVKENPFGSSPNVTSSLNCPAEISQEDLPGNHPDLSVDPLVEPPHTMELISEAPGNLNVLKPLSSTEYTSVKTELNINVSDMETSNSSQRVIEPLPISSNLSPCLDPVDLKKLDIVETISVDKSGEEISKQHQPEYSNIVIHQSIGNIDTFSLSLSSDTSSADNNMGQNAKQKNGVSYIQANKCPICDKNYSSQTALRRHQIIHTGLKPFCCDICSFHCNRISNLTLHMQIHANEMSYKCDLCEKVFNRSSYLAKHKLFHTSVETIENVIVHGDIRSDNLSFECVICSKAFPKIVGIKNHLKVHTRTYGPNRCVICEKSFGDKHTLKRHMITHSSMKPHNCIICARGFNQRSHLERHMKTHTGERPYKCEICGYPFSSFSHLKRHIKTHIPKPIL